MNGENLITKKMIKDSVEISDLVIKNGLESARLNGEENKAYREKYIQIIKKNLDKFRDENGKTPNQLLDEFLKKYIQQKNLVDNFESRQFTFYGQKVNSYVWACISKKDSNIQFNRASYYPQLYILINSHGIKFGFCYGYYVENNNQMVETVRSNSDLQNEFLKILNINHDLNLYSTVEAEKQPNSSDRLKPNSPEEIREIWSKDSHIIAFIEKNDIDDTVGNRITSTFNDLLNLFKTTSLVVTSHINLTKKNDKPSKSDDIIILKNGFYHYLFKKGYLFDKTFIENFLLSLKVKPFLILTGNSGTGKTKIALLFAQYLNEKRKTRLHPYIESDVTVGKSATSGGWAFQKEAFFSKYPNLKKYEGIYPIEINGKKSYGRLELTPRLFYDSKDQDLKNMLDTLSKRDYNKKIRLKIELPDASITTDTCYRIIPVGANWTENRHIVGFHNVITDTYQKTDALDLILCAINKEDLPHFLILDEMNLSHVERYFADFLSAMESEEKIPLHNSDHIDEIQKIPKNISIPSNILVIGTVNVDETTYMFSPKVLDRANTIEFYILPAKNYMSGISTQTELIGDIEYLENPLSDTDLRKWNIDKLHEEFGYIKTPDGKLFWDVFSDELTKFQNALRKSGFDFGFRVINEITRFMYVAWKYERKPANWENWQRYFDTQIKQKILPKVHGSQRTIGDLLQKLFNLCSMQDNQKPPRDTPLSELKRMPYPSSIEKIKEMDQILHEQRYVSFTK
jgi:Cdc6-like AAA superfamily ATPase